jgi:hypothetical protein
MAKPPERIKGTFGFFASYKDEIRNSDKKFLQSSEFRTKLDWQSICVADTDRLLTSVIEILKHT